MQASFLTVKESICCFTVLKQHILSSMGHLRKTRGGVPNVSFSMWSVWPEGRSDRQLSPSLRYPDVLSVRPSGH